MHLKSSGLKAVRSVRMKEKRARNVSVREEREPSPSEAGITRSRRPAGNIRIPRLTQPADNGSCESLMKNTACTLSSRQCAFSSEEGTCLHEYATYSCETRTSGKQMICGGDVFCLDGECDKATSGKSNDFGQAVSELAALAAAGKDVAALNGWMSGHSPEKRSSVRSLLPASVTAAKTAAGARMWGWHAAAARKRRWPKRKRQADGQYRGILL